VLVTGDKDLLAVSVRAPVPSLNPHGWWELLQCQDDEASADEPTSCRTAFRSFARQANNTPTFSIAEKRGNTAG
jgi:hypothetical protein